MNKITFSPKHIKVFFGTSIAMFIVVALQLLGVHAPKLVLPTPQHKDIFFDVLQPKLDQIENNFHIQKPTKFVPDAGAAEDYENAAAYAVVDFDSGEVLASKNLSSRLPIASLTKIMSSVVALDIAKPEDRFAYTQQASMVVPTKIGGTIGEQLSVNELLHAGLMTSANDAMETLRDGIDAKYNGDYFVRSMNEKAQYIGLHNTSFANPQGFDNPANYSSAEDLAILTHYALSNYPLIADIAKQDFVEYQADTFHKQIDLNNWNGLLDVYPQTIGLKIGNTRAAGYTTVVVSERDNKKLIVVVLGAPGIIQRDMWAAELLDLGYQKSLGLQAVNVTETQLRVKYSTWKYWN